MKLHLIESLARNKLGFRIDIAVGRCWKKDMKKPVVPTRHEQLCDGSTVAGGNHSDIKFQLVVVS